MKPAIIPNPVLDHVFGSKLRTFMTCHRKYYYTYIRQLQMRGYYLPFVMGKIFHIGVEEWYNGADAETVLRNTARRINVFLFGNIVDNEKRKRVRTEIAVVQGMLKGYMKLYDGEREECEVLHAEQTFSIKLGFIPIDFIGTIDLLMMKMDGLYLSDHKTARWFDQGTIDNVPMDSQIQAYPLLVRRCIGEEVVGLSYNIIRKPSIRHKQGETFDEFIQRIYDEYSTKTDDYFLRKEVKFQKKHADKVWRDLQLVATELFNKHEVLCHDSMCKHDELFVEVLDENNWARDTRRCHDYNSRCEFWPICRYGGNRYTEPFLYQQREHLERGDIIYEEGPKEDQARSKID